MPGERPKGGQFGVTRQNGWHGLECFCGRIYIKGTNVPKSAIVFHYNLTLDTEQASYLYLEVLSQFLIRNTSDEQSFYPLPFVQFSKNSHTMSVFKLSTVALAAISTLLSISGKASAAAIDTTILETRAVIPPSPSVNYFIRSQTEIDGTPFNVAGSVGMGGTLSYAESYSVPHPPPARSPVVALSPPHSLARTAFAPWLPAMHCLR